MAKTVWGAAIQRQVSERGWSQRQLAQRASIQPNTLTSIIKHGSHADTKTFKRIADALEVEICELFLTQEQSMILKASHEIEIERIKAAVLKELTPILTELIEQELARSTGTAKSPKPAAKSKRKRSHTKARKARS